MIVDWWGSWLWIGLALIVAVGMLGQLVAYLCRRSLRRRRHEDLLPAFAPSRAAELRIETLCRIHPDGRLEVVRSPQIRGRRWQLWIGDQPDGIYELHILPLVPHPEHSVPTSVAIPCEIGEPVIETLAIEGGRVVRMSDTERALQAEVSRGAEAEPPGGSA